MTTTIQKWGNSNAIRLPKIIMDALSLQTNDPIEIIQQDNAILLKKTTQTRRAKKSLEERLTAFYNKPIEEILNDETLYNPGEPDWGAPVGNEVW